MRWRIQGCVDMDAMVIAKYPSRLLRSRCRPIEKVTEKEKALFADMFRTMRHFSGIGLAAPQVGIPLRLIVAAVQDHAVAVANPRILSVQGADYMLEGCLSVPGIGVDVERAYEITVQGLNAANRMVEFKARGLLARVLQHEVDHLNGKLIIDYLPFWNNMKFRISSVLGVRGKTPRFSR